MASPDAHDHRLKFLLVIKEFAEVFQDHQWKPIPIRRLTQAYQSKHRKNFSPRQFGFSGIDGFVEELSLFSQADPGSSAVTFSRSKFLQLLLKPVLERCRGVTASVRTSAIVGCFKSCTGFEVDSICEVLQVNNIDELLSEAQLMSLEQRGPTDKCTSSTRGERRRHVHDDRTGCADGAKSVDSGLSFQEHGQSRSTTKASIADRMSRSPQLDVNEYCLPSRSPRPLLPRPMQPLAHPVNGSPPLALSPRPSPSQPISPRDHLPNIKSHINVSSGNYSPPVLMQSHHQHSEMISPYHQHQGERGSGVGMASYQQPPGVREGKNLQVDPVHHVGSPSICTLPEYLPLSPDSRSTMIPTSSGCSVPTSSGHLSHIVTPQATSSPHVPPHLGHPSPPLRQQSPTSRRNEIASKFPHQNLTLEQETLLPSHSAFRPDLPIPRTPQGATKVSLSRKKQGIVDTKQKAIEKINAKVEELIVDLSSQGKFLQPDMLRRLVMEMIQSENRSRMDRIIYRDITAMGDYSKVHGRVEELIKVFCWFSPVTSLHELELAIIETEKVVSYEALHLGPITKHPKVMDLFKLQEAASLDSAPDISAYKIQDYLMKFISKKKRSEKYSLEDFLEYVRERENAESVYHLCIRITSFPLAIQVHSITYDITFDTK